MKITINENIISDTNEIDDPVLKAIEKYKKHPSILAIKKISKNNIFSFQKVSYEDIIKEIQNLDASKACQDTDVPTKIIKNNSDIFGDFIYQNFNDAVDTDIFPNVLKNANVSPVFKKGSRTCETNYRPVSILPNISKIYERCMYKQMSIFFDEILSQYQCGFRKGFSSQHCLAPMLEKWRESIDNGGCFGALLTDLSKAFDCLLHYLLIAKLHAYGFDMNALKFLHSYLSDRKQRVKINNEYSSFEEIVFGVPQGSILGPLLFNIFISDLFLIIKDIDIASYADDNTPYCSYDNFGDGISCLEKTASDLFEWFSNNGMKANADKCHLLLSTYEKLTANISNFIITDSEKEKLLGVTFDNDRKFESHINSLCSKASQKLDALSRMSSYMSLGQRRLIMKSFISSQFGYCPMIWMNHSRALNNKINRIHERALRLVYRDKKSTFEELLNKDNSVKFHIKNLQVIVTEMFEVKNKLSAEIMNGVFPVVEPSYMLRKNCNFVSRRRKTVFSGSETLMHLGPSLWRILPNEFKESDSLNEFKTKIKRWIPENCPCRLCKRYVKHVGFI